MEKTDDDFREVQNPKSKGKKFRVQVPQKQPLHGIDVGNGVNFRPSKPKQVYVVVSKKPNANKEKINNEASTSGMTVATSKLFVALAMDDTDESGIPCPTPIVEKIRKLKKLIIDGKATLVDDDGHPLKNVDYPGNKKEAKMDGSQNTGKDSQEQLVSDLREKEQAAASKPSSSSSPYAKPSSSSSLYISSTKLVKPFSKVGDVVCFNNDEDEVLESDSPMAKYLASASGDYEVEDYFSDYYAAQVYDLPGHLDDFCYQYDIKLRGRGRK